MPNLGISPKSNSLYSQMLAYLTSGELRLPAVNIHLAATEVPFSPSHTRDIRPDAIVELSWQSKVHTFALECKSQSTPKSINEAINQVLRYSQATGVAPMIYVPYLSPAALDQLEASGVSGIDMSGNGIINIPGEMLIYKTGSPNRFPSRRKGPNPYQGASSLVARTLTIQPEFESSRDIEAFISERNGAIGQGTISKALNELEEDLVIVRRGRSICVLQYDILLDNLVRNFERPDPRDIRMYKVSNSPAGIVSRIMERAAELGEEVVITGTGSASHYTAMAQSPPLPIYCRRLDLLEGIADPGIRFPNVSIQQMTDTGAYFDARHEDGRPWASPVQTYVELMSGGARDREMADQVRQLFSHGANDALR